MACLDIDMYNQNNDHKALSAPPQMNSPRISFSNDFVESSNTNTHPSHQQIMRAYRDAPVSSDFQFSVSNYSMMSADELFFKGKLLPFKESCSTNNQKTTLRDELLIEDDNNNYSNLKPPKSSTRWRGFLGLKKSHNASKKVDKNEVSVQKIRPSAPHEDAHATKNSQESNSRDFEFRL